MMRAFNHKPIDCYRSEDYLVVFKSEKEIITLTPDFDLLSQWDLRGVIVTSTSSTFDFVARFFAPKYGIPEDPVTGSAYTQLTPYWGKKFNKNRLTAKQLSKRGGELVCELNGDRVRLFGKAIKFFEASISDDYLS